MTGAEGSTGAGRVPGAILVVGWAVFSAGVAIAFSAPSLRDEPPSLTDDIAAEALVIAGNPVAWQWALGLILAAAVIAELVNALIGHEPPPASPTAPLANPR